MTINDIIKRLGVYDGNMEARVINTAIEDAEYCPTFDIVDVFSAEGESEDERVNFVCIEISDPRLLESFDIGVN